VSEPEKCTIVVVVRDRFSTTSRCLDHLFKNTPEPHDLLVVLGGAPEKIKKDLSACFEGRVRFIFGPDLLNPSQSRNVGLRECKTPLAVLMDNDVFVRPGWLTPLIRRQAMTGAAMVVPVILDEEEEVHTAGNDLYISYRNGKAYGCKLVDVQLALRLGVYDEKLREVGEVDSGLTWAKAGCPMYFEAASVVYFQYPLEITRPEDIRSFLFKWDTRAIADGYDHFQKKWNMDITEGGKWKDFLVVLNAKLGFFPRLFPSAFGMLLDAAYRHLRMVLGIPRQWQLSVKRHYLGRHLWREEKD
jgi:glycosyltransferase involved in cell wall biosynthesis